MEATNDAQGTTDSSQAMAVEPSSLNIVATSVAGQELSLEMNSDSTVNDVRIKLASELELVPEALLFYASTGVVPYSKSLSELHDGGDAILNLQFLEVDPMLDLGRFDSAPHSGITVDFHQGPQGEHSTLRKTSNNPDSNNVFLLGRIVRPCFVEFEVVTCLDEMSFGVTYNAETVQKASDFANLRLESTWLMSKRKQMPVLMFGGKRPAPPEQFKHGFGDHDRVMIIADPEERRVRFYRNDVLVADNLPDDPLPAFDPEGAALRMYCMVDATRDEIRVARWGPAESLDAYAQA